MTSEEKFTAWLDGELDESERVAFERTLSAEAFAERDAWGTLRGGLREVVPPAQILHREFLVSQVMNQVRVDGAKPMLDRAVGAWHFPRFAWLGVALMVVAAVLTVFLYPERGGVPEDAQMVTQILETHPVQEGTTAFAFNTHGNSAAVLWIENAGYIPPDQQIK